MNIHDIDTVAIHPDGESMVIIDQTLLPGEVKLLSLSGREEIWEAIRSLRVRGAPAIGAAAAIGAYLAVRRVYSDDFNEMHAAFIKEKEYLASARPTAVNLFWALERMYKRFLSCRDMARGELIAEMRSEAQAIMNEDAEACRMMGEHGLTLARPGWGILTHCNAGKLATIRYGTATAPIYLGQQRGYNFRVYADETRPLLQGARLTAFELQAAGVDVTLQCDNMAASTMKRGLVQAVFTGADRVAANGDTANKIGTLAAAIAAKRYGIPFYVFAPVSTIDLNTSSGEHIDIEQRDPSEVTDLWYKKPMAPDGIKVLNPAFDVTDAELITAIVTERGIARPPYGESLKALIG